MPPLTSMNRLKCNPIRTVVVPCHVAFFWIYPLIRLDMMQNTHTATRILFWMELKPVLVLKSLKYLVCIIFFAIKEPDRFTFGMAGHRPAQRLVTCKTDGFSNSKKLLPFGRSAPLHINAVTLIAVITFCETRMHRVGNYIFNNFACANKAHLNLPVQYHFSSLLFCHLYPFSQ